MERNVISVSKVNQYIKSMFDQDQTLSSIWISGEVSNYKVYPSGHHYFTLKDSGGSLRCVMFKGSALRLRFRPENGMKVLAAGRITVFPRDGAYQLYCEHMTPDGAGDLYVAFEQLKTKLHQEGLFQPEHKKPLPAYPEKIAIVTSSAGAAVHDILRVLGKRYPLTKAILLPVRVQGTEAPAEICGAIRYVNRFHLADLIIAGRGGGSMEDLWAFNDERVARAIYESEIPVISAVGHEPDVTISDFVADFRAATPSNAAELAVPDQVELKEKLESIKSRIQQSLHRKLTLTRQQVDALSSKRVLQSPLNYLQDRRLLLDYQQKQLAHLMQQEVFQKKQRFVELTSAMDAMSPLKVLARGYSVAKNADGRILTDIRQVHVGEAICITLKNGELEAAVTDIRGGNTDGRKNHL